MREPVPVLETTPQHTVHSRGTPTVLSWSTRFTQETEYSVNELSDNDAHPGEARGLLAGSVELGAVQQLKRPALDHLLLPPNGDGTCAELLEEPLIFRVKLNILDLRGGPERVHVFGVDHVGFWHPGGLREPRLQTVEVDALKKDMVSWVITTTVKKTQYMFN